MSLPARNAGAAAVDRGPSLPRAVALAALCAGCFLLLLVFGSPPQALGLDSAWMQVVSWALLHQLQWGRDVVFTYGPLGLLQPYGAYVPGAFGWYAAGYVAIPAAFALSATLLLARAPARLLLAFAAVLACSFPRLPGDICWMLTMAFGTTCALQLVAQRRRGFLYALLAALASLFAGLALIKLSLVPIWVLSYATLLAVCGSARLWPAALCTLVGFPAALLGAWMLCAQDPANLPAYLASQLELGYGYSHAMGERAPFLAELAALLVLAAFLLVCAGGALHRRRSPAAVVSLLFVAAIAALSWLAFFTRADEFHWPNLFVVLAFLPFALWLNPFVALRRGASFALAGVIAACLAIGFTRAAPADLLRDAQRLTTGLDTLLHLDRLREQRDQEWRAAQAAGAMPEIRERVGGGRVDLLTWQQGLVLVNGFSYAPRPVFQSYSAYTPTLARLNERYFLGASAPEFVLLQLDYSDGRFPASEDGLALLAILRRYRPELIRDNLLLLRRDAGVTAPAPLSIPEHAQPATLGSDVRVARAGSAQVVFLDIRLNWFGRLYTTVFREPALYLSLRTDTGEDRRDRLVRLSASSGFLLTPVVTSARDWLRLYFSKALPSVQGIRIDTELPWERRLFMPTFTVAVAPFAPLAPSGAVPSELRSMAAPDFSLPPSDGAPPRIIVEDGRDSAFLHAPGALSFRPAPGTYRLSASYGIQGAALADAACLRANPNGIGVSVVRSSAGTDTFLWHNEIDPFHEPADRGPQELRLDQVVIEQGDTVSYRVDPGDNGTNIACDWSYVRDFSLLRRGGPNWANTHRTLIFEGGFE